MARSKRIGKWFGQLLPAVAATLILGILLLVGVTALLLGVGSGKSTLDVLKVSGPIVVGIGAAVGLVVAYRRQRYLEDDAAGKREAYAQAAQQLGDPIAAVRLAGAYAMAKLADDWEANRQQCVDVLCAYLRLPWVVNTPGQLPPTRTIVERQTIGSTRVTQEYAGQVGEAEVRRTIVSIIADHLRVEPVDAMRIPWIGLTLDVTGATFPDRINFREIDLSHYAIFTNATFGDAACFDFATFGDRGLFADTTFGDRASFVKAIFGSGASFTGASFGYNTEFGEAVFGGSAQFNDVVFGGSAQFNGANFSHDARFSSATFGDRARFGLAVFGNNAKFDGAGFGSNASFKDSKFGDGARFGDGSQMVHPAYANSDRFEEAVLQDPTRFGHALFGTWAEFQGVSFGRNARFGYAVFDSWANFSGATRETEPIVSFQLADGRSGVERIEGDALTLDQIYED